jgi:tetratricopeptide (TPR) repeat protein
MKSGIEGGFMTMLKTEHYNISYTGVLPDLIDYPMELIEGLTEKLAVNDNGTNINNVFKWAPLGKNVLERYTEMSNQQPRRKRPGYVVFIRWLHSGFNTWFNRPKGQGIKPLGTNKKIQKLRSELAWALLDMGEHEKVLEIANTIIKSLENVKEENSAIISSYYRLLSSAQNGCGEYKNALENIHKAIAINKSNPNNYCIMGNIFINENDFENAERALKTALEKSIKQGGEDSPHTASIYQSYSRFYWQTKQENQCLEYAEKAYEMMKKHLGEENLYTLRCSFYWGIYLFYKGQYRDALKRMKEPAKMLTGILGEKNREVMHANENLGKILIKMNNYDEAFKYFENLLFIANNNADLLLALSYCATTMHAPELVGIINNKKVIDEIMVKNNTGCFTNDALTNAIYNACELFDIIPAEFYEIVADLLAKAMRGI